MYVLRLDKECFRLENPKNRVQYNIYKPIYRDVRWVGMYSSAPSSAAIIGWPYDGRGYF